MADHFVQNFVLLFKQESAYGVDPTLDPAVDAMLLEAEAPDPIAGTFVERNFRRGGFHGARPQVPVNKHQAMNFTTELTGSAEKTTPIPPKIGTLFETCGFLKTLVPTTGTTYSIQTDPALYTSGYGELYNATNKWTFPGCRGNAVISLPENNFPTVAWSLMSEYLAPAVTAIGAGLDLSAWLDPTPISKEFTTVFTLDSIPLVHINSTFDMGMNVVSEDRPNVGEQISVTDNPGSGTMSILFAGIGVKNWVQEAVDNQKRMPLSIVHQNTAADWKLTITAPLIQLTGYGLGNANEKVTEDMTFSIVGDAANNPFTMLFDTVA